MARVLITGAGRGIGLELTRQYLGRGDTVLAGARRSTQAPELHRLGEEHGSRLIVLPLEVTDEDSVRECRRRAGEVVDGLEVLINNAAINPGDATRGQGALLDVESMLEVLRVNVGAPIVVAQCFLDLLHKGTHPRIVNVSSGAGSLTQSTSGGDYVYGASKAALNMVTRTLAFNVAKEGIVTIALDPGWVQTDMGGPDAHLKPHESGAGILRVVDGLTDGDTGRFLSYDGRDVPW